MVGRKIELKTPLFYIDFQIMQMPCRLSYITLEVQDGYISITYLDKLNDDISKKEMAKEAKKESSEEI